MRKRFYCQCLGEGTTQRALIGFSWTRRWKNTGQQLYSRRLVVYFVSKKLEPYITYIRHDPYVGGLFVLALFVRMRPFVPSRLRARCCVCDSGVASTLWVIIYVCPCACACVSVSVPAYSRYSTCLSILGYSGIYINQLRWKTRTIMSTEVIFLTGWD